jgi:hypothetical protein
VSSYTFSADFEPGQTVTLVALDCPARVSLVRVDQGGLVDYFVTWWADGKRCQEWLSAAEIA